MPTNTTIIHIISVALLAMLLAFTSCGPDEFLIRRDMYANVSRYPKVRLEPHWLDLFGERPSGMTVLMEGVDGNDYSTTTNSVDGIDITLPADSYHTLVYNLSPDEFGSLDFYNTNSYDSIRAMLTPITLRENKEWDKGTTYMQEPENIAVALDTVNITPEMVETYSATIRQRLSDGIKGDRADTVMYVFPEYPFPVVSKLNVYVHVLGLKNAASVEGRISGMADGYYLSGLHATAGKGCHLLDSWKARYDQGSNRDGWIRATISTFGLPYGTEDVVGRDSTLNYLTLCFNLVDNKTTKVYNYAVGDLFKYANDSIHIHNYSTAVTLELNLSIDADSRGNTIPDLPDVKPNGDSPTGFDATVDDWENGGTSDVTM